MGDDGVQRTLGRIEGELVAIHAHLLIHDAALTKIEERTVQSLRYWGLFVAAITSIAGTVALGVSLLLRGG